MSADDPNTWHVYTDYPKWQRRLEAIGAMPVRPATHGSGKFYMLPANQVTLRKPKKPMPEGRRVELANRMRALRAAKETT